MIQRAKRYFPKGEWLQCDMRSLVLEQSFDLVMAWHSLFHLPPDDQVMVLSTLANLTKPGGLLVFTSGPQEGEVWSDNGGIELYHASLSSEAYADVLSQHCCKVLLHNIDDPQCGGATVWIAQKKS